MPGKTTYEEWLRRQPGLMQDFVRGPTRGLILRQNPRVQLSKFVGALGRRRKLNQLAVKEAELFKNMGDAALRKAARISRSAGSGRKLAARG